MVFVVYLQIIFTGVSEYLSQSCWQHSCVITREVSSSFSDLRALLALNIPSACFQSLQRSLFAFCMVGEGRPRNTVVLAAAHSL